jgi:hypothetical protein
LQGQLYWGDLTSKEHERDRLPMPKGGLKWLRRIPSGKGAMSFRTPPGEKQSINAELLPMLREAFQAYDAGLERRTAFRKVVEVGISRIFSGDAVAVTESLCDDLPKLREDGASEDKMVGAIISAGFDLHGPFFGRR